MTDLIEKCIKLKKKTGVYQIHSDSWTDLGQLSDLKKPTKIFNKINADNMYYMCSRWIKRSFR